jgi:hypothetical protein
MRNDYAKAIKVAKELCWNEFLERAVKVGMDLWAAGRLVHETPTDGSRLRVPDLRMEEEGGRVRYLITNEQKGTAFHREFFPMPPEKNYVPHDYPYPPPKWRFKPVSDGLVCRVFRKMRSNRRTMEGTLHNNVMRNAADILAPFAGPLIRAKAVPQTDFEWWYRCDVRKEMVRLPEQFEPALQGNDVAPINEGMDW